MLDLFSDSKYGNYSNAPFYKDYGNPATAGALCKTHPTCIACTNNSQTTYIQKFVGNKETVLTNCFLQ